MKTITPLIFCLFSVLALLQSCTKIDEPYYTVSAVVIDTTKRTVLLEDYTGHTCVNCAPAAKTASSIQDIYQGEVFVVSVHAGTFAKPSNDPKYYPYLTGDYTCETGNTWFDYSGFNIDRNPKGMVNRRLYNGNVSFGTSDWNEAVKIAVALPKVAIMSLHSSYDAQNKSLNAKVGVKFLADVTGPVSLTVCLLEDEIYGGQLNIIKPDSTPIIKNFRFMHVLRGSMNGNFGEEIVTNPMANSLISKSYNMDFNGKSWIPANCSVIAFISDANTKEVLHVVRSHVGK